MHVRRSRAGSGCIALPEAGARAVSSSLRRRALRPSTGANALMLTGHVATGTAADLMLSLMMLECRASTDCLFGAAARTLLCWAPCIGTGSARACRQHDTLAVLCRMIVCFNACAALMPDGAALISGHIVFIEVQCLLRSCYVLYRRQPGDTEVGAQANSRQPQPKLTWRIKKQGSQRQQTCWTHRQHYADSSSSLSCLRFTCVCRCGLFFSLCVHCRAPAGVQRL